MEELKEGLLGSGLLDTNKSEPNEEALNVGLQQAVSQAAGVDNADLSNCSNEELEALLAKLSISESLDVISKNIDKYDESVITKCLIDRYGFLDDEATNIYESIKVSNSLKEFKKSFNKANMTDDEFYAALDDAAEKGLIPTKYQYDWYADMGIVPTEEDTFLEGCLVNNGK